MNYDRLYATTDSTETTVDLATALMRITDTIRDSDTKAHHTKSQEAIEKLYALEGIVLPGMHGLLNDSMPEGERIDLTNDLIGYLATDPELPTDDDEWKQTLLDDITDVINGVRDNPQLREQVIADVNNILERLSITNHDFKQVTADHFQAIEAPIH